MLHNKEKSITYSVDTNQHVDTTEGADGGDDDDDEDEEEEEAFTNMQLSNNGAHNLVAPFPFKVAKALDPDMYRNIEYDTWLEVRRGKSFSYVLSIKITTIKSYRVTFGRLVLRR